MRQENGAPEHAAAGPSAYEARISELEAKVEASAREVAALKGALAAIGHALSVIGSTPPRSPEQPPRQVSGARRLSPRVTPRPSVDPVVATRSRPSSEHIPAAPKPSKPRLLPARPTVPAPQPPKSAPKGLHKRTSKNVTGGCESSAYDAASLGAWTALAKRLPVALEQRKERMALFRSFDPNGNGHLSLAEVDRGLIMLLSDKAGKDVDALRFCKPAIMRAFQAAKGSSGRTDGVNGDYVERKEFRLLLLYLHRYFELLTMFDEVDTGEDRRVSIDEFRAALPKLKAWGVEVTDPEAEFARADADGAGLILFAEFADWALTRGLEAVRPPGMPAADSAAAAVLQAEAEVQGQDRADPEPDQQPQSHDGIDDREAKRGLGSMLLTLLDEYQA